MNAAIERELEDLKINHLLHLALTVLTFGIWAIVWGHIAQRNMEKKRSLLNAVKAAESNKAAYDHSYSPIDVNKNESILDIQKIKNGFIINGYALTNEDPYKEVHFTKNVLEKILIELGLDLECTATREGLSINVVSTDSFKC